MENELPLYKIVLTGDSTVGKSCIIGRLVHGRQPTNDERPTIGVEFGSLIVRNAYFEGKLQIWDTAGQQRYRAISAAYYRNSRLVVFVFDVTNEDSFTKLKTWMEEAKKLLGPEDNCQYFIIGNKTDLAATRQVSTHQAETFAAGHNIRYIETSAMTNDNMDGVLEIMCELLSENATSFDQSVSVSTNDVETEKWRDTVLSVLDHVHDMKFHQIYQIYSPIIKISAPKLLESHVQDELFRVSGDSQLWHKILNNIHFGTREELNLNEISQVLQISMILDCSTLKKYAMAQLVKRISRERMVNVLPNMVKTPFMNEDHKRAVLQYLYQHPVSPSMLEKIRLVVDEKTFNDYQIWKNQPRELSSLLEMDSDQEQKLTPQDRFFAIANQLFEHRDSTGDLVLKSGGSDESNPAFSVKVHKLVVAARCDFIKSCLNSNLKEASEGVIEIKGFTSEELTALIEYFYTNSYSHFVNPNTCVSILSMAPYLMLTKETNSSVDHSAMLAAVEKTVMEDISDDTCLDLALNAHKNEDGELKRIAIKYIIDNYFNVSVKHEDQFSKLPKALMFIIMNKMILKLAGGHYQQYRQ